MTEYMTKTICVNFQLLFSFNTVASGGFVFFGVFEISCLCSNFSWNFVFSLLVSVRFLGPVARSISRRFTSFGGASMTYLLAAQFIDIHKYPSMCPIVLSVSPFTSPSGFYTSHCISFRCQICRYDHYGDPLNHVSFHLL